MSRQRATKATAKKSATKDAARKSFDELDFDTIVTAWELVPFVLAALVGRAARGDHAALAIIAEAQAAMHREKRRAYFREILGAG